MMDRCVSCGGYVPEGNMVCRKCTEETNQKKELLMEIYVKINRFSKIHDFIKLATLCPGEVYLIGDNYKVSAKSIMGVFSLNTAKPIKAEFHGVIPNEVQEELKKFIVEKE